MEMSKCEMCKKSAVCQYKDKVADLLRKMYPLNVECKEFESFIDPPLPMYETSQEKKRNFPW